jgi:hypothetical protein
VTQSSLFWPTNGVGDGASQYTDAQLFAWLRRTFLGATATEGVHAGYVNELAVSGAASPLSIATGAALVDGIPYENTAVVSLAVPTPVVGTTGHRVVLKANWAAQTVRVALVSSADGNAAIPAVTQTPGTTYEISLATLTITTGGVITVTDARAYCHYGTRVSTAMIDADAVTPAKIPNRTRKIFVPATSAWNTTGSVLERAQGGQGFYCADSDLTDVFGEFRMPSDLVSLTSIKAVVVSDASGNGYLRNRAYYGPAGSAYDAHSEIVGLAAVALTATLVTEVQQLTLASPAVGANDYIGLVLERDATNVADTISGGVSVKGWVFEYIADM